jgi:hypothetical protein
MRVTTTMTKDRVRASISSAVNRSRLGLGVNRSNRISFNFLLQYRGYKVFWAVLSKLTTGLLATSITEVVRVLAKVAVLVLATR